MKVEADFRVDMATLWKEQLQKAGCKVPPDTDPLAIGRMYFNTRFKLIAPKPRRVHRSIELGAQPLSDSLRGGLARFVVAAERGFKLTPFLSKSVLKADKNDLLDNDWGVKHFHLGMLSRDGSVARTGELLFARVDEDDIYLLEVLGHKSFSTIRLIEILDRNWPQLLEPNVLKGCLAGDKGWSDEERQGIRKAGRVPLLQINGKVYFPPGGGFATSGISTRVMYHLQAALEHGDMMQQEAVEMTAEIAAQIERDTGAVPSTILVRLTFRDGTWKYQYSFTP